MLVNVPMYLVRGGVHGIWILGVKHKILTPPQFLYYEGVNIRTMTKEGHE